MLPVLRPTAGQRWVAGPAAAAGSLSACADRRPAGYLPRPCCAVPRLFDQREPPRAGRLDVEGFRGQLQPAHGVARKLQPHGIQFEAPGQAVEQQRGRDTIETAVVEGPAQVAGLQVVAAAEDRLVQEGEHGLGPLAGCAANLVGAAQGFDEQVEALAVTPQLGVAIDPAGDQSGLQQREPAEPAVVDLIEQPLLQRGEPRCENLRSAGRDGQFSRVGQHVGHHVPMVVVGDGACQSRAGVACSVAPIRPVSSASTTSHARPGTWNCLSARIVTPMAKLLESLTAGPSPAAERRTIATTLRCEMATLQFAKDPS